MNKFAQTAAWLRHAGTAASTAIAVLGVLAGLSPTDQQALLEAINQFVDGSTKILAAAGAVTSIGLALYARFTAKPAQQVAAVQAIDGVKVVPDGTAPIPAAVAAKLDPPPAH